MDLKKHKRIFNIISPVYNLFYKGQVRSYSELIDSYGDEVELTGREEILDLGCGTGAFGAAFAARGHKVRGIDLAEKMVSKAEARGLLCNSGNILEGVSFDDNSFDLVICAYVAHGLDREKRSVLFREAARISRGPVLFHDYSTKRNLFIDIIEYLEDGDYFNFIRTGLSEMKEAFSSVKVIPVRSFNNWYLCRKRS
ncbi:class I SAM-dependent methyltransferase [Spirochaeta isovalerica]|uniref:2-polyprenyl-3-methyl-5-hydroxy-6-metoxy-1, 4-benzoquinol methylase n=1 Tax=Spirochaeta isovalerica TaxID=150 RepID=A0A841RF34_9SPIO|nr:class I SAM-dependent methyltransferase [Spirochaeta isovalerica]MBB6481827.1 2-polyprenyl-3-methyl-5-hydroxy-6-metoxy-1,4-benzoquinol methylase [Spirochaeta isovalerica]